MDRSYVTSWGDSGTAAPDLFIRYAGGTLPYPKLVSSSIGTVFAPEMMPTDLYIVSQQGPTTTDVLLSEFGQCPAPTQESFSVGVPPSASQMFDTTFGLPVPGALQAGDSVRAIRSTRGSTRFVIHRQAPRQTRLPYLSSVHAGAAIGTKGYGDFPYTDEHGITHQPVGRVDPVVNRTQINVLYDGKTVKLDASTNSLYADILGMDAPGSASDTIPPGPLHAGRGLVITPGPGPADPPAVTMQTGGSIEDGKYQWAWSILRGGKETGLSPGQTGTAGDVTTGGTTTTYRSASIDLPGVLTGDPATAVKLYRRDTSIGADGTIHTKFVYASHGVGVLVSDPSVGAVVSDTGSLTGYELYTVVTTKGPIVAGMVFVYNALAYVTTDDPPLLIDPRDGSTTTLDVSSNGESAFVTSDGGVLNPTNGDITYPTSSAKNLTTFKLVASLAITPLTYVDTLSNTALGATYQRDVQTIHNLPFGGDGIQLHDLELDDFHHYIVHNIRLSTDADGTNVSGLTINAPYVGLPGQDLSITETSGSYPNALAVRLNPDTMEFDSEWRISAIAGGSGLTCPTDFECDPPLHGAMGTFNYINHGAVNPSGSFDKGFTSYSINDADTNSFNIIWMSTDSSVGQPSTNSNRPFTLDWDGTEGRANIDMSGSITTPWFINAGQGLPDGGASGAAHTLAGEVVFTPSFEGTGRKSRANFHSAAYFDGNDDIDTVGAMFNCDVLFSGHTSYAGSNGSMTFTDGSTLTLGSTTGTEIGTSPTQKIGFYGASPIVRPTGGAATAGATYTATEQGMIQRMYTALRALGLLS